MKKLIFRSFLCGPSNRFDVVQRAIDCGSHVAHFDIEDSIPLAKKESVRNDIVQQLLQVTDILTAVRINSLNSAEGLKDIMSFIENNVVPDIVIVPKIESPDGIKLVSDLLKDNFKNVKIFGVIESIKGVKSLDRIIHAENHIDGLVFGSADFSKDLGRIPSALDLSYAKNEISLAANYINALAVDSPCFAIKDLSVLKDELEKAKELGFHAKIAIHPSQISLINKILSPTKEEINFATQILTETEDVEKKAGIVTVGGTMIGPPFLNIAKSIVNQESKF